MRVGVFRGNRGSWWASDVIGAREQRLCTHFTKRLRWSRKSRRCLAVIRQGLDRAMRLTIFLLLKREVGYIHVIS